MIEITHAQVMAARSIVRKAQADGRTPNPATVALANRDAESLAAIAQRLEIKKINAPRKRARKPAQDA